MSSRDTTNSGRSSRPTSVPQQGPRVWRLAAGGAASVQSSVVSIHQGRRLFSDPVRPPNPPREYRDPSPESVFTRDETGAGSLQYPQYDVLDDAAISPPVRQHQYVQQAISEGEQSTVAPKEIRINLPRVRHNQYNEQRIKSLDTHHQSIIRSYSTDSKDIQVRVLTAIFERFPTQICRIRRRDNLPNGGIECVTCSVCPEDPPSQFEKQNALRIFAEHFMRVHLGIAKPFACVSCSKLFSLGQVRDRHEQKVHHVYRPKARVPSSRRSRNPSSEDLLQSVAINNNIPPMITGGHADGVDDEAPSFSGNDGQGFMIGAQSHASPLPASQLMPPFDNMLADDDGETASHLAEEWIKPHSPRGMHVTFPYVTDPTPATMPRAASTMGSNDPQINHMWPSPIDAQGPSQSMVGNTLTLGLDQPHYPILSTNGHASAQYPQVGDSTWAGPHHEQHQRGLAGSGAMYNNPQDMMPYLNTQTWGERNGYSSHRSPQRPFNLVGQAFYPTQQQQHQHQGGSPLVAPENASTSSLRGSRSQNGDFAMSHMALQPGQMPARGAPLNTTATMYSSQAHGTTTDMDEIWTHYSSSRPSTSNSASNAAQFATQQNGNGTTWYNPPYTNTNSQGGARWQHPR